MGFSSTIDAIPIPKQKESYPFRVIYDHREDAGLWRFPEGLQLVRSTLKTGDYTIEGFESLFTIERKAADDAIGSITEGHARFQAEHERMSEMVASGGFACVIVESSLDEICRAMDTSFAFGERRSSGSNMLGIVATWPFAYRVPWHFAGSRQTAENLALRIMEKSYGHLRSLALRQRLRAAVGDN